MPRQIVRVESSDDVARELDVRSDGRHVQLTQPHGILAAVGCLGLLIIMFVKKPLVLKVAIGTMVLCGVAAIVYPGIETGPMDAMAPRPQMLVALGLAVVGADGAWLASREQTSRQQAQAVA